MRGKGKESLKFCTIKCKLSSIVPSGDVRRQIETCVKAAHVAFKRASFFLRLYCLSVEECPPINISTVRHCFNMVCSSDPRGANVKVDEVGEEMQKFWNDKFSVIYPDRVDMIGRSYLKQVLVQQLVDNILVDVRNHTESRCIKVVTSLLKKEREISGTEYTTRDLRNKALKATKAIFEGRYDELPSSIKELIIPILPEEVEKCLRYDLKKNTTNYITFAMKLCRLDLDGRTCFMPTRRSCVPCHVKLDTEVLAQLLIPHGERLKHKKEASDRKSYNDWVWNRILARRVVDRKLSRSGFRFHHEISTDGVAASVLYSRKILEGDATLNDGGNPQRKRAHSPCPSTSSNTGSCDVPCSRVGLDPGKKNILTLIDSKGVKLRYTKCQRQFESGTVRYRKVLEMEKSKREGILEHEANLSKFSHRTHDPVAYTDYLKCKAKTDSETEDFYACKKWRRWKFRMFCRKKSSESRLMDRISLSYGKDCVIYYGNWSRTDQMRGCDPTPAKGMRDLVRKRFTVESVDEFRTSKMCSSCGEPLKRYRNRRGKYSHSRLFCSSERCTLGSLKCKTFVDRDYNAAYNILMAGESADRPLYLSRTVSKASACPPRKRMRTCAAKSESGEDSKLLPNEGLVGASPSSSDPPHSLGVGCLGNETTKVVCRP